MLSVIKFKKSLFAGVLDGGEKEVFLGGSRLSKFMETVEKTTGSIPAAVVEEAPVKETERGADEESAKPQTAEAVSTPTAAGDAWAGLLTTGLDFLGKILGSAQSPAQSAASKGVSVVRRDEKTGESYLHLPMPAPETMERLLGAVSTLLEKFGSKRS